MIMVPNLSQNTKSLKITYHPTISTNHKPILKLKKSQKTKLNKKVNIPTFLKENTLLKNLNILSSKVTLKSIAGSEKMSIKIYMKIKMKKKFKIVTSKNKII